MFLNIKINRWQSTATYQPKKKLWLLAGMCDFFSISVKQFNITSMNANQKNQNNQLRCLIIMLSIFAVVLATRAFADVEGRAVYPEKPVILSAAEIDYQPLCFVNQDGRATGFSVELLEAVLGAMGRRATFRTGLWSEVKDLLEHDKIDALPLVGRTPEREAIFDFTFPYLTLHGTIVVRKGTTGISALNDLKNRSVAVLKSDIAEEFLRRNNPDCEIITYPSFETALKELSRGQHDAVVIQRLLALQIIKENGLGNLEVIDESLKDFHQEFCFAVTEGDKETLALLNEGLALVMADGTAAMLQNKWLTSLEPHGIPLATLFLYIAVVGGPLLLILFGFTMLWLRREVKRRTAELYQSQLKYSRLYERSSDAIFVVEKATGRYLDANQAAVSLTGYSVDEIKTKTTLQLAPKNAEKRLVIIAASGRSEALNLGEVVYLRSDGTQRIAWLTTVPLDDTTLYGIAQDITDRKKSEEELLASEKKFSEVFRLSPNAVSLSSITTGLILEINQGFIRLFGSTAQDIVGKTSLELNIWVTPSEREKIINKLIGAGRITNEETQFRIIDGTILDAMVSAVIIEVKGEQVILSEVMDITQRKQTENAVRDSESRFSTVMNSMEAIMYVADMDTYELLFINDFTRQLFGDVLGQPCWKVLQTNQSGPCSFCTNDKLIKNDKPADTHIWDFQNTITKRWYHIQDRTIYWVDNRLVRMEIATDITELKETEIQLQDATTKLAEINQTLEERINSEVKKRQHQQQLFIQRSKLESLGKLAAGMAHEINQPLAGISLGLDNMLTKVTRGTSSPDYLQKKIDTILENIERINSIIKHVRIFSREQAVERIEKINPETIYRNALSIVETQYRHQGIQIQISSGEHTDYALGNPYRLEQVFLNILSNARDALLDNNNFEKGFRRNIEVQIYSTRHLIHIDTMDNGCGIDPDLEKNVMEPFFTTKGPKSDTGLGLSICYGIIREMDGDIKIETRQGEYTTVKITLPRRYDGKQTK